MGIFHMYQKSERGEKGNFHMYEKSENEFPYV